MSPKLTDTSEIKHPYLLVCYCAIKHEQTADMLKSQTYQEWPGYIVLPKLTDTSVCDTELNLWHVFGETQLL